MKTIKIESLLFDKLKPKLEQIIALRQSIEKLSESAYRHDKDMWVFIREQLPTISDRCKIDYDGKEIILTDLLAKENEKTS